MKSSWKSNKSFDDYHLLFGMGHALDLHLGLEQLRKLDRGRHCIFALTNIPNIPPPVVQVMLQKFNPNENKSLVPLR